MKINNTERSVKHSSGLYRDEMLWWEDKGWIAMVKLLKWLYMMAEIDAHEVPNAIFFWPYAKTGWKKENNNFNN